MVSAAATPTQADQVNLLSIQEGTFPVVETESYGGWPVVALLDDSPETGWACPEGNIADNAIELGRSQNRRVELVRY